jgi:hypothetical protein
MSEMGSTGPLYRSLEGMAIAWTNASSGASTKLPTWNAS